MKVLLKGARIVDPSQSLDAPKDLLIENGLISAIDNNISTDNIEHVYEFDQNQWLVPGLIDVHVHLRDPGFPHRETVETGTEAALAGGFTAVCCMPNTQPVLGDSLTLNYLNDVVKQKSRIAVYPIAAATKNIEGIEPTDMAALKELGAVAFSDDGHSIMNARVARLVMQYAKMLDVPFVCHAEDTNLSGKGCMHEGHYSTLLGLPGYPSVAESVMVARDIELSRLTGARVHFTHISAKESIVLIRRAKEEGLPITVDVTPHHLALTDADLIDYDPNKKMNPPLRSEEDAQALIEGLQDGTIDAIATDHAPWADDEKGQAFDCCPNGVIGLETSLGVVLTKLYHTKKLSALQVIEKMSTLPAQCLSLPGGTLKPGSPADITIIDPSLSWTVDASQFKSKSRNSSFIGHTLQGRAIQVFRQGAEILGSYTPKQIVTPA